MITLQKYGVRSAASFIPIKMLLPKKKGVAKKCADLFRLISFTLDRKKQHKKQSTAACSSQTNVLLIGATCQTTLLLHVQHLNQVKKMQLTKKFQTAHCY